MKPIETDDLTIHFDSRACIHARRCVLGLPGVFNPDAKPWINPANGVSKDIEAVIESCPSGALRYQRKNGETEAQARTNTIRVWENGPLEVRGDIRVEGQAPRTRALLCRCGKTDNPPFCDNSHRQGFSATGLPPFHEKRDRVPEETAGPLTVTPQENGSYKIEGPVEIIAGDGSRVARVGKAFLCRCGSSGDKPFCDGSHRKIGFHKASSVTVE